MKQIRGYTATDFLDEAISPLNDIESELEEMLGYDEREDREGCYKRILEAVEEIREGMR